MASAELTEHLKFEPIDVINSVSVVRQVGRIVGGALAYAISPDEMNGYGYDNSYSQLQDWSVVLETQGGFLKLERNKWLGPTIGLMYPDVANALDEELVANIFEAEATELHTVFHPKNDGSENYTKLTGSYRLPETDAEGRHYWLGLDQSRISGTHVGTVEQVAVLNGRVGELVVSRSGLHNIALHRGYNGTYIEEEPAKSSLDAVQQMSDKFKQLTIAVANQLGGARQITAPYKYGDLRPSYVAHPHNLVARWLIRGYVVSQGERKPDEHTDSGYAVITGTKNRLSGTETIVAEEGLSAFYYSRGAKQWRYTRGLLLRNAAKISDLDDLLAG